jgi:hypothetical protein
MKWSAKRWFWSCGVSCDEIDNISIAGTLIVKFDVY